ncbi:hypothetical protein BOX15_Mlig031528g4, partial [Macrostomum lignano]
YPMPVELRAELTQGSIFLAGEPLVCKICISNCDQTYESPMLAWASVQLICMCSITKAPAKASQAVNGETSFIANRGETGFTYISTKPSILFCNLVLRPGESKFYEYEESLPWDAPPSHRGAGIRYSYKLVLGVSSLLGKTQLLRLPFRVLSVHGIKRIDQTLSTGDDGGAASQANKANPFVDWHPANTDEASQEETILAQISAITGSKCLSGYNICNSQGGRVTRFSLFKTAYKLGENVLGVFDFADCTAQCLDVKVSLQSVETVYQTEDSGERKPVAYHTCTHAVEQLAALDLQAAQLLLHLKPSLTPSFATRHADLAWKLAFEFATLRQPINDRPAPLQPLATLWQPPATVATEHFEWELPITVYACSPQAITASSVSAYAPSCSIVLA